MADTRTPYEKMAAHIGEMERESPTPTESVVVLDNEGNRLGSEAEAVNGGRVLRGADADAYLAAQDAQGGAKSRKAAPADKSEKSSTSDKTSEGGQV